MTLLEISKKYYSNKPAYYLGIYEKYFETFIDNEFALLELGGTPGGSLEMWADYFPRGKIVGIDQKDIIETGLDGVPIFRARKAVPKVFHSDRIVVRQGSQADEQFLRQVTANECPRGWDVIIDDCSHVGELSQASFLALFPLLRVGGLYIVEDWATGYLSEFPDGARFDFGSHYAVRDGHFPVHTAGLSGFVKQFIDELGMDDIHRAEGGGRRTVFEWVHCYKGLIIAKKIRQEPNLRGCLKA